MVSYPCKWTRKENHMPFIQISLIAGRSDEKVRELIKNVTDTVAKTLEAPHANIRVLVSEIPASHWGIGGAPASEVRKIQKN
ncbi:4-oxalocrotonate tautomerase [Aneurinibacillus migulanus]|uniref:4-oxalocrotonate tautomerase n=1 Tax=Aneurinibacillus migulanus TaxID=47500 RepID=UPI002286723E|nr:4-oxalocrotonate tautomerase [Aneurinibacillus migulanus]